MSERLQLRVSGMTCGGCENAVKRTLMKLSGVEAVQASHASEAVDVTFEPASVTREDIGKAITALGYTVHS